MSPNPETRPEPAKDIKSSSSERVKQRQSANRPAVTTGALPNQGAKPSSAATAKSTDSGSDERCQLIAERAYFLAEQRQFIGGDPVADWLQAEREIDRRAEPLVDSPR